MTNTSDTSTDGAWVRGGTRADQERATESLEQELSELSERIAVDPPRFQEVRFELQRRRLLKDEQPTPAELTGEQRRENDKLSVTRAYNAMVNKVIAMESEQAQLVIEAEVLRSQRDDAATRLALLVKTGTLVSKSKIDDLVVALRSVPSGGASGEAPTWIVHLHRAACEIAGTQVVEREPTTTPHLEDARKMLEKHTK